MSSAARVCSALLLSLMGLVTLSAGQDLDPEAPSARFPVNGLGVSLPADWLLRPQSAGTSLPLPDDWRSPSSEAPLYVRIQIPDRALDHPDGLDALLVQLAGRTLAPVLVLEPPPPDATWTGDLDFDVNLWLGCLDTVLAGLHLAAPLIQIIDHASARFSPRQHAFLLKRVSLLVRALFPDAVLSTGVLAHAERLQDLAADGVAPYLDALCLEGGEKMEERLTAARHAFPSLRLWDCNAGGRDYLKEAGRAFSRSISMVLARPGTAPKASVLAAWRRFLGPEMAVVSSPFRRVRAQGPHGKPLPADDLMEVKNIQHQTHYVVLFSPLEAGPVTLIVQGPPVGIAWRVDPETGEETISGTGAAMPPASGPGRGNEAPSPLALESHVRLAPAPPPLLVRLGRRGGLTAPAVSEVVRGKRGLTVEEIVARHRQFQARQDRAIQSVVAEARINYHFSLANLNQTFDVTTVNRFMDDGTTTLYEERELYLNGSLWKGKKPPDLPFVLPERVTEVPLDLLMDRRYRFRLLGREQVGTREAYVVAFDPISSTEGAYRGKVWVDTELFSKLKMEAVELHPKIPVISNKILQTFSPVEQGGHTWWLNTRVEGQMVFTALGRNVVLERRLDYSGFRINPEDLDQQVDRAYASSNQVLEATDQGFKRLRKVENRDGAVTIQESSVTSSGVSRLLVGRMSMGNGFNPGLPVAGVNYFNFDYKGTGSQVDLVWAGPFVDLFWSDPSFMGSKTILSLEARVNPISSTNKRDDVTDAIQDDVKGERVKIATQTLSGIVGYPISTNHKLEIQVDINFKDFRGDDETAPTFTVPSDTMDRSLTLRWVYNRAGFRVNGTVQGGTRTNWRFWGRPDGSDFSPSDRQYLKSALVFNKNFFPRGLDRFGFRLSLFDGSSLDRFSMFNFSGFGPGNITGFGGSELRAERGGVLDLNYSVSLRGRTRLDFNVNHGRFRNGDDFGPHFEHATGGRVALNFSGPWNSFLRVSLGSALESSVDDLDQNSSLRVTLFRTFDRWFWQGRRKAQEPAGTILPALGK
ncbi:MAG: hypothetical protein ACE5ID_03215 [Acidobacteriota bacterium]